MLRRRGDRDDLYARSGGLDLDFDLGFLRERDVARADDACAERSRKNQERETTDKMTLDKGDDSHDWLRKGVVCDRPLVWI
jgi:hypothetical protein